MLFDFTHDHDHDHDHDGERLSGVYDGDPSEAIAVVLHGAGSSGTGQPLPLVGEFGAYGYRRGAVEFRAPRKHRQTGQVEPRARAAAGTPRPNP